MIYKCRRCQKDIEYKGLCDDCHRRVLDETRKSSHKQYVSTRERNVSQSRSAINTSLGPTVLAPIMSTMFLVVTCVLFAVIYPDNLFAALTLGLTVSCFIAFMMSFGIVWIGLLVENPTLAIAGLFMFGLPFFLYASKGDPQFDHARVVLGISGISSMLFLGLHTMT